MKRTMRNPWGILLLLLVFIVATTGCQQQTAVEMPGSTAETVVYTGALHSDYENALDVTSQLALGILRLENTAEAVTAEQAVQMLPLWKTLQNSAMSVQAERFALTKQLETALTDMQVVAITAMQLTEADAQTWLMEQGPAGGAPGRQMPGADTGESGAQMPAGARGDAQGMSEEDRAAMREQFQNMADAPRLSDEDRAQMREQFAQGGGALPGRPGGATTGTSAILTRAVLTLMTERSGEVVVAAVVTEPSAEETTPNEEVVPVATAPVVVLTTWTTLPAGTVRAPRAYAALPTRFLGDSVSPATTTCKNRSGPLASVGPL